MNMPTAIVVEAQNCVGADPGATLGWQSLRTNGVNLLALRCINVHTRELIYVTQRNIQEFTGVANGR